ncbi:hypothetical protein Bca4012_067706 [Brassica carinata]
MSKPDPNPTCSDPKPSSDDNDPVADINHTTEELSDKSQECGIFNWKIDRERVREREREEDEENPRLMECKTAITKAVYLPNDKGQFCITSGREGANMERLVDSATLNNRPREKECPFYMRNGSCKFGGDCKFNHPDPTSIGGVGSPLFRGNDGGSFSTKDAPQASWSSSRHMSGTGTAPFIPVMHSQNHGYQAPSVYPPERSVLPRSTYSANNQLAETSSFSQFQQQMTVEEFPERPDQPECSYYVKTGDCKFKYKCKYHHPKNRLPKQSPSSFNDKGLPLRPGQSMCTHYSRYGICKFGPACRFDHSIPPAFSSSSSQTVEAPQVIGNGNENDNWN